MAWGAWAHVGISFTKFYKLLEDITTCELNHQEISCWVFLSANIDSLDASCFLSFLLHLWLPLLLAISVVIPSTSITWYWVLLLTVKILISLIRFLYLDYQLCPVFLLGLMKFYVSLPIRQWFWTPSCSVLPEAYSHTISIATLEATLFWHFNLQMLCMSKLDECCLM